MGMVNILRRKWQGLQRRRAIGKLIRPEDLVLEVGVGIQPLKRSDILLDKFVAVTSIHRTSNEKIKEFHRKPFILGDGRNLPFRDQSIDVVLCRHVIEHVDDVVGFVQELQRVGKKGYLEWPSIFCELVRGGYGRQEQILELFPARQQPILRQLKHGEGTPGHRWFIVALGQRLYITAKTKDLYPLYLMYGAYAKSLPQGSAKYPPLLSSCVTWSPGRPIEPILIGAAVSNDVADSLRETYNIEEQLACLRETARDSASPRWRELEARGILCCPLCKHGDLVPKDDGCLCTICRGKYPQVSGVRVFLKPAPVQPAGPGVHNAVRGSPA
jgi:SAM-dependent methyltransferase